MAGKAGSDLAALRVSCLCAIVMCWLLLWWLGDLKFSDDMRLQACLFTGHTGPDWNTSSGYAVAYGPGSMINTVNSIPWAWSYQTRKSPNSSSTNPENSAYCMTLWHELAGVVFLLLSLCLCAGHDCVLQSSSTDDHTSWLPVCTVNNYCSSVFFPFNERLFKGTVRHRLWPG